MELESAAAAPGGGCQGRHSRGQRGGREAGGDHRRSAPRGARPPPTTPRPPRAPPPLPRRSRHCGTSGRCRRCRAARKPALPRSCGGRSPGCGRCGRRGEPGHRGRAEGQRVRPSVGQRRPRGDQPRHGCQGGRRADAVVGRQRHARGRHRLVPEPGDRSGRDQRPDRRRCSSPTPRPPAIDVASAYARDRQRRGDGDRHRQQRHPDRRRRRARRASSTPPTPMRRRCTPPRRRCGHRHRSSRPMTAAQQAAEDAARAIKASKVAIEAAIGAAKEAKGRRRRGTRAPAMPRARRPPTPPARSGWPIEAGHDAAVARQASINAKSYAGHGGQGLGGTPTRSPSRSRRRRAVGEHVRRLDEDHRRRDDPDRHRRPGRAIPKIDEMIEAEKKARLTSWMRRRGRTPGTRASTSETARTSSGPLLQHRGRGGHRHGGRACGCSGCARSVTRPT